MKIKIPQLKTTNNVWPISGCNINKDETIPVNINERKYFKVLSLIFLLHKIIATITIKKGLSISIG